MSAERHRDEERLRRSLASRRLLAATGSGDLEESDAEDIASRAIRRARRGTKDAVKETAPSPDEVRERRGSGRL